MADTKIRIGVQDDTGDISQIAAKIKGIFAGLGDSLKTGVSGALTGLSTGLVSGNILGGAIQGFGTGVVLDQLTNKLGRISSYSSKSSIRQEFEETSEKKKNIDQNRQLTIKERIDFEKELEIEKGEQEEFEKNRKRRLEQRRKRLSQFESLPNRVSRKADELSREAGVENLGIFSTNFVQNTGRFAALSAGMAPGKGLETLAQKTKDLGRTFELMGESRRNEIRNEFENSEKAKKIKEDLLKQGKSESEIRSALDNQLKKEFKSDARLKSLDNFGSVLKKVGSTVELFGENLKKAGGMAGQVLYNYVDTSIGLIKTGMNNMGISSELFTLTGFLSRSIQEANQLEEASGGLNTLAANKGGGLRYLMGDESGSAYQAAMFGIKAADFAPYMKQVALSTGSVAGLGNKAISQYGAEKGYGLEQGALMQTAKLLRTDDKETDVSKMMKKMLNIFDKSKLFNIDKGDFSQLKDSIEVNQNILSTQSQTNEKTNTDLAMKIQAAFASQIGGKFADYRRGQALQGIDAGLKQGSNEFVQAALMRTYQKVLGPNASLYDVQKEQSKGLFGSEFGSRVLNDVLKSGVLGQGQMKYMSLKTMFPQLDYDTIERLANGEISLDQIKEGEQYGEKTGIQRAASSTGRTRGRVARINNRLAGFGSMAMDKLDPIVSAIENGDFSGAVKESINLMMEAGSYLVKNIAEGMSNMADDMYDRMSGREVGSTRKMKEGVNMIDEALSDKELSLPGVAERRAREIAKKDQGKADVFKLKIGEAALKSLEKTNPDDERVKNAKKLQGTMGLEVVRGRGGESEYNKAQQELMKLQMSLFQDVNKGNIKNIGKNVEFFNESKNEALNSTNATESLGNTASEALINALNKNTEAVKSQNTTKTNQVYSGKTK